MAKILRITLIVLLVGFVVIQFFPIEKNVSTTVPPTDFMSVNDVPDNVSAQLTVSCYDCHSNNTNYPWYSEVQPAAWYLEHHVKEGKKELNFNEWGDLSKRRKRSKLNSIINQIEEDEMPLQSYTLIHRDAVLTPNEEQQLLTLFYKLKDSI